MDPFPDLHEMSDDELASTLANLEEEESACSLHRRMLHGRIDLLRPALVERLRVEVAAGHTPAATGPPGRQLYAGTGGEGGRLDDLGPMPDVDTLSTDELRALIRDLEAQEDDVSLRRRFLQGAVDILRAERARRQRGGPGVGPDDLGSILGGRG